MSEYIYIIENLKCPGVETLRGWLENRQMTHVFLVRKSVEAIVQAFDQRNAEIIWRKQEMQKRIDQDKADAQAEHDKQMALYAASDGQLNLASVLAVYGEQIKSICGHLAYNVLLAAAQIDLERFQLCVCGHPMSDHGLISPHPCYWSQGGPRNYQDCDCDAFLAHVDPQTLPLFAQTAEKDGVGRPSDTQEPRDNGR